MILADACAGRGQRVGGPVRPARLNLRASAPSLVEENVQTGYRMVRDRLVNRGTRPIEELEPGEGDIVEPRGREGGRPTATTTGT